MCVLSTTCPPKIIRGQVVILVLFVQIWLQIAVLPFSFTQTICIHTFVVIQISFSIAVLGLLRCLLIAYTFMIPGASFFFLL